MLKRDVRRDPARRPRGDRAQGSTLKSPPPTARTLTKGGPAAIRALLFGRPAVELGWQAHVPALSMAAWGRDVRRPGSVSVRHRENQCRVLALSISLASASHCSTNARSCALVSGSRARLASSRHSSALSRQRSALSCSGMKPRRVHRVAQRGWRRGGSRQFSRSRSSFARWIKIKDMAHSPIKRAMLIALNKRVRVPRW